MRFSTTSAPGGRAASAPLMGDAEEPTIFELSVPKRRSYSPRNTEVPSMDLDEIRAWVREEPVDLPEVSERDLVAHYTRLASRNYSVDLGAYPLGSCTMKYNPKFADQVAAIDGLTNVHPLTPPGGDSRMASALARPRALRLRDHRHGSSYTAAASGCEWRTHWPPDNEGISRFSWSHTYQGRHPRFGTWD